MDQDIASSVNKFLNAICEKYKIIDINSPKTCVAILVSGKNKGKLCNKKALHNGFCTRHQTNGLNIKRVSPKRESKQLKLIEEWMATAIPIRETHLKHFLGKNTQKGDDRYIHPETELLFNKDFVVIGKLHKENILKLSSNDIEKCEFNAWKYASDCVESDSDD